MAPDDPAFKNPTKPIGGFYERQKGEQMRERYAWQMAEVSGGRLRRVVPSPLPQSIVEIELIRRLTQAGELLVVAGGGGIPVSRDDEGDLVGVEAVIDKDRTSALLAGAVDAGTFLIATNVERVALDFGQPTQRFLDRLTIAEARRHLAQGQFPSGSMGPKVEAAIAFLEQSRRSDARVIICELRHVADALAGRAGTQLERN